LLMRFCPHNSSMLYPQVRTNILFIDVVWSIERQSLIRARDHPDDYDENQLTLSFASPSHLFSCLLGGQTQSQFTIRMSIMCLHRTNTRSVINI
jgi:hypothetical protein